METTRILSRQDCCERSCHEDASQIHTFDNAYTPREYKLQAGLQDDHQYAPPPLRGTSAPNGMECVVEKNWASQLACDDCVITHAPDISQSGCFREWKWIPLPPCETTRYGPDLLTAAWLGDPQYMSKDITTMLRHPEILTPECRRDAVKMRVAR
eukprot:9475492-Pyramimonas_sp.AAC.1